MEVRNLIHIVPSNKWGEVQQYALGICRNYLSSGWNVSAMTLNALAVDTPFNDLNIPLFHGPLNGFGDFRSVRELAKRLRQLPDHPTVIHVHRYRDAFMAVLARKLSKRKDIKIVSTRHAVRRGRTSPIFQWIYQGVDAHIFVSSIAYEKFRKSFTSRRIRKPENVYIIRYSLDMEAQSVASDPPSGPFVFLYQGYISPGQKLEALIDALALIPKRKFRLRICGPGNPDYLDRLRTRAMRLGVMDSIDWHTQSIPTIENATRANAGIVSFAARETVALPSLMLMAVGRPQILLSHGFSSEYLEDGHTSIIIPDDNPADIADAITRLTTDQELCKSLGTNALQTYNRILSWQHFINAINEIYTK